VIRSFEALPWDSEFFGFAIGRIDLDDLDPEAVLAVEAEARSAGITCLYGSADPEDAERSVLLQRLGWRFVEAATLFSLRPDEPPIPRPPGITFRPGTPDDLPRMDALVARLARWSRYAADPRFGVDQALRLQRAWIARAAGCETGEYSLMVAEDERGIVSFISRCATPQPVVDTVGTSAAGSGSARYLIEDARAWAGEGELLGGPIAARNVNALRYVGHCGYRVKQVRYLYHRWLDEELP
jgi:dTDP-4-amino-4,6-dideoxy-D-galactose acyltransferase